MHMPTKWARGRRGLWGMDSLRVARTFRSWNPSLLIPALLRLASEGVEKARADALIEAQEVWGALESIIYWSRRRRISMEISRRK